jgi:DHA1 family tetracycline resistance protein-like MFS transporter
MHSHFRAGQPRAALVLVSLFVALDFLAQSITYPLLPRLTQQLLPGDPARVARWVGWLEVGWAAPQFLAAPGLGALSDRFGRRPVLVVSALGLGLELILNALAPTIWWLLSGRILCGLSCSGQATAMAYVADITEGRDSARRTAAFAAVNAALWGGVVIGPALGGVLAGIDLRAPFWLAAGVTLAAGAYGWKVLPESLMPDRRAARVALSIAPWHALAVLTEHPALPVLGLASLLTALAQQGYGATCVLYTAHRYGWSAKAFGIFFTALAVAGVATQGALAGRVAHGLGNQAAVLAGLAFQAAGMAAIGMAPTGALFSAANLPFILGGVADTALRSMMAAMVPPERQGRLQGALAAILGLACILAPPLFTQLFAWTTGGSGRTGIVPLTGALLTLGAFGILALRRKDQV